jgi:hypothetical protein
MPTAPTAAQTPAPPPGAAPATPGSAASPDVYVDASGHVHGVDGVLNQIAAAVVAQATPVVRDQLMPILQNDRQLQATVGAAAGQAMAGPLWVVAAVAAGYAGWSVYRTVQRDRRRRRPR